MKIRSLAVAAASLALLSLSTPAALAQTTGSLAAGSLGPQGGIATDFGGSLGSLTGAPGNSGPAPIVETPEQKADREALAAIEKALNGLATASGATHTVAADAIAGSCLSDALSGKLDFESYQPGISQAMQPGYQNDYDCLVMRVAKSNLDYLVTNLKDSASWADPSDAAGQKYGLATSADSLYYYMALAADGGYYY